MAHLRKARSAAAAILPEAESAISQRSTAAGGIANGGSRVAEIEKQLAKALKERDDLARDVESLCMQSGSSIFDGSMVLTERVFAAEKELASTKAQLAVVTEERNNLREDLRGHKDSKRTVDKSWRVERERAEKLEKELQFYQSQSARAMADRDRASWEAEELKSSALAMEAKMSRAEGQAETAVQERDELQSLLLEAQKRIKELEVKARECETIPGLWRHIAENTKQIKEMEVAHDALEKSLSLAKSDHQEAKELLSETQRQLAGAEQELEETRAKAHSDSKAASAKIKRLEGTVAELQSAGTVLEARLKEAEEAVVTAQSELKTSTSGHDAKVLQLSSEHSNKLAALEAARRGEVEPLQNEVEDVKARLKHMTAEFEKATAEKVQALLRVGQAEQTAEQAFLETGNLLEQIADLKDRATQATQEKVAALMQVANLKEQLRNGAKSPSGALSQTRASSWRFWETGAPSEAPEAEGQPHTSVEPKEKVPQDLRQAIDQLRGVNERVADLGNLASANERLRQQAEELQDALSDCPTHLQRKELAKKVAALGDSISQLEEGHRGLIGSGALDSGGKTGNEGESDTKKTLPNNEISRSGDSAAARELVYNLRLILTSLQYQSGQKV